MAKPPKKPKPPAERAKHVAARKEINQELDKRLAERAASAPKPANPGKPDGGANG